MPISVSDLPKRKIAELRSIPRDISLFLENVTTSLQLNIPVQAGGYGLDLLLESKDTTTDNSTTITIDKSKQITLVRDTTFSLSNVLFAHIDIPEPTLGHVLNIYILGVSNELLEALLK